MVRLLHRRRLVAVALVVAATHLTTSQGQLVDNSAEPPLWPTQEGDGTLSGMSSLVGPLRQPGQAWRVESISPVALLLDAAGRAVAITRPPTGRGEPSRAYVAIFNTIPGVGGGELYVYRPIATNGMVASSIALSTSDCVVTPNHLGINYPSLGVAAYSTQSGQQLWTAEPAGVPQVLPPPLIVDAPLDGVDPVLYAIVGGFNRTTRVAALNGTTGERLPSRDANFTSISGTAGFCRATVGGLGANRRLVVLSTGRLAAYDLATQQEAWVTPEHFGSFVCPRMAPDGTTVYLITNDNQRNSSQAFVYCYETVSGALRWISRIDTDRVGQLPAFHAVGNDGRVYLVSSTRYLYVLRPADGKLVHSSPFGLGGKSGVMGSDGTLYIVDNDRRIHAVESDGKELWSPPLPQVEDNGGRTHLVIAPNGVLLAAGRDLIAFSSTNAAPTPSVTPTPTPSAQPNESDQPSNQFSGRDIGIGIGTGLLIGAVIVAIAAVVLVRRLRRRQARERAPLLST